MPSLDTDLDNSIFYALYTYYKLQDNITSSNMYKYITKFLEEKGIKTIHHNSTDKKKKDKKEKYDGNKKELIDDAQKSIEKILEGKDENTFNPIVKRTELLGFLNYESKISNEYIKKYESFINDDREFKNHTTSKYYLELMEKPEIIQKRYNYALNKGFSIKVNESMLGKFELLRRLKYNTGVNKKEDFEKLRTICRLSEKTNCEYNELFFYKVLMHLNLDFVDSKKKMKDGVRKQEYSINDEKLNIHRELIKIKDNAPKKGELDIFDVFELN